ncbi:flavin reductase family protein [Streptomyces sp. NPDC001100]
MTWHTPIALPPLPGSAPASVPGEPCAQPSAQAFRDVMAHLPAGVSVITTDGIHGPAGMTASAVCSLSLDPPLVLVCVDNNSRTLVRIRDHGTFAVNVLRQDQANLAKDFADRDTDQRKRFAAASCRHEAGGSLVLDGALAWLSCQVQDTYPGGDHTILTGRVNALGYTHSQPLVWYSRRFHALA